MRFLSLLVTMLMISAVCAQESDVLSRTGWDPLPDTLFLIWKLDTDQIKRVGMIEEDYDAERARLMSDTTLSDKNRDARSRTMAAGRRKELQGVLTAEPYKDWMARSRASQR